MERAQQVQPNTLELQPHLAAKLDPVTSDTTTSVFQDKSTSPTGEDAVKSRRSPLPATVMLTLSNALGSWQVCNYGAEGGEGDWYLLLLPGVLLTLLPVADYTLDLNNISATIFPALLVTFWSVAMALLSEEQLGRWFTVFLSDAPYWKVYFLCIGLGLGSQPDDRTRDKSVGVEALVRLLLLAVSTFLTPTLISARISDKELATRSWDLAMETSLSMGVAQFGTWALQNVSLAPAVRPPSRSAVGGRRLHESWRRWRPQPPSPPWSPPDLDVLVDPSSRGGADDWHARVAGAASAQELRRGGVETVDIALGDELAALVLARFGPTCCARAWLLTASDAVLLAGTPACGLWGLSADDLLGACAGGQHGAAAGAVLRQLGRGGLCGVHVESLREAGLTLSRLAELGFGQRADVARVVDGDARALDEGELADKENRAPSWHGALWSAFW